MGIVSAFFGDVVTIVGYTLFLTAVYKLYQIAADLGEIKKLLKDRATFGTSLSTPVQAASFGDLRPADDASEYAERLLRAVNAESSPSSPSIWPSSRER